MRGYIPRVLWDFLLPDLTRLFRWRVQLDCGCISEVLTREDSTPPHKTQWKALHSSLPPGQMICHHDNSPPPPYRVIAEWGGRREVTFPVDPVEPPDDTDPRIWSMIRHDKPHTSAFWEVTLACGHVEETIAPSLDWVPASGPRRAAPERVQQMSAEFEEAWRGNPELQTERDREHTRRMLADGWPTPEPAQLCYFCPQVRMISAYERVGWLTESRAPFVCAYRAGGPLDRLVPLRRPVDRGTLDRRLGLVRSITVSTAPAPELPGPEVGC